MARNPTYTFTGSFLDQSGERSTTTIHVLDDTILLSSPAATTFFNALADISACDFVGKSALQSSRLSALLNGAGNREDKILWIYQDNVTLERFTFETPGRSPILNTLPGTDDIDITITPYVEFVAAFEAIGVSPDGNPASMLAARLVGRSR